MRMHAEAVQSRGIRRESSFASKRAVLLSLSEANTAEATQRASERVLYRRYTMLYEA